jgi:hypothetical protein
MEGHHIGIGHYLASVQQMGENTYVQAVQHWTYKVI